jgi:hypothetical protein
MDNKTGKINDLDEKVFNIYTHPKTIWRSQYRYSVKFQTGTKKFGQLQYLTIMHSAKVRLSHVWKFGNSVIFHYCHSVDFYSVKVWVPIILCWSKNANRDFLGALFKKHQLHQCCL